MRHSGKFGIVAVCMVVASCGGSEGNSSSSSVATCASGSSPITGCWVTESCESLTDVQGNSLNSWSRGYYHFATDGSIRPNIKLYDNASCYGPPIATSADNGAPLVDGQYPVSLSYQDLGAQLLSDGSTGRRLNVTWSSQIFTDTVESFAVIANNGRLCLSRNLTLGAQTYLYDKSLASDINYQNCLLSSNEP